MATPPVCKLLDYAKWRYEEAQRDKEARRRTTHTVIKEMKYRPKIGGGDFDTKTRMVKRFLEEGHKVKITIMFRGREMQHPELGRRILDRIAEDVVEVGKVEIMPKQDGRNMTMVLGPDKKAQQTAKKAGAAADKATGAPPATNGSAAASPPEAVVDTEVAPAQSAAVTESATADPEASATT